MEKFSKNFNSNRQRLIFLEVLKNKKHPFDQ